MLYSARNKADFSVAKFVGKTIPSILTSSANAHLLLYKAEKPSVCLSVRPHFFGGQFLGRGCMDRRQTCSM